MTKPTSTSRHCMQERRLTAAVNWYVALREAKRHQEFKPSNIQKLKQWLSDPKNRRCLDDVLRIMGLLESVPPEVWDAIIDKDKGASQTRSAAGTGSSRAKCRLDS